jgi:hypothetical protein
VPKAQRDEGDEKLRELFQEFQGQLVSPGGAAALLGLSRKTIYTLGKRGRIRVFEGPEVRHLKGIISEGPRWVYIPMADLAKYAEEVGRPFPKGTWLTLDYLLSDVFADEVDEALTESDDSPTV